MLTDRTSWCGILDLEDRWPPVFIDEDYQESNLHRNLTQRPIIYFYCPRANVFDHFEFSQRAVDHLNKVGLTIFTPDPLAYYDIEYPQHSMNVYSEFSGDQPITNIRADELDSLEDLILRHKLTNVSFFITDSGPIDHFLQIYKGISIENNSQQFISREIQDKECNFTKNWSKKFFVATRRYSPSRAIVCAYLNNFDCHMSWFYKVEYSIATDNPWFNAEEFSQKQLTYIKNGIRNVSDEQPRLDQDLEPTSILIPNRPKQTSALLQVTTELNKFCRNALVSIVNETRFAQPFSIITEKTMIPIANFRPFILAAPPGSIAHLQSFGFKTFSNWWDESYDQEQNHSRRLAMVLDIVDQINKMSDKETDAMLEDMRETLYYNSDLAKHYTELELILYPSC